MSFLAQPKMGASRILQARLKEKERERGGGNRQTQTEGEVHLDDIQGYYVS